MTICCKNKLFTIISINITLHYYKSSIMNEITEILKYVLPSLVVFITSFYLVRAYFRSEENKLRHQRLIESQNITTPLRLQAYERIIIFLERISFESLIMRINKQGLTCQQLQSELLKNIRSEFDHNLSQQIYISQPAWEVVKAAKIKTIQQVNLISEKTDKDSPSINLSKALLESLMEAEKEPSADAISLIKKEVRELFGD